MERLADPVGLRALDLRLRVVDVLHGQIERVVVPIVTTRHSVRRSVKTRFNGISCSLKNGTTRSLSRSAAVIGIFRS